MELLKKFEMLGKHPRSSCHPSEQSNRALSPKCNAAVYQGEGISVCRGHFGSSLVLPVTSLVVHVAGIHLFSNLITVAYKPTFELHCIKCSASLNPSFPHFLFFMEFRQLLNLLAFTVPLVGAAEDFPAKHWALKFSSVLCSSFLNSSKSKCVSVTGAVFPRAWFLQWVLHWEQRRSIHACFRCIADGLTMNLCYYLNSKYY